MDMHRQRQSHQDSAAGACLPCPGCRTGVFTRRDMLLTNLDGSAQCPACGETVRLDVFGRWVLSCFLALVLPTALIYGNVFYSGHLFLVSIAIILGVWRGLSFLFLPFLTLETVPSGSALARGGNALVFAVLIGGALVVDAFMASRFESPDALQAESRDAERRR